MKKPVFIVYIAVFALFVWADRVFKDLVSGHMQLGEAIPAADAFFSIRYVINDGVSFSMLRGNTTLLIVLQSALFIITAAILIRTYLKIRHPVLQTGLTWIVAGGAGNLTDRIRFGYVIDYISVGRFPIWNFADMCIIGGCILLGVYVFFLYGKKPREDGVPPSDREND
ncbi:MAG: signal peptidase II [Clostridiales Family XIII bacterium]|nr:signal peptidase II [Clostridiales Family XIII bacterium]